MNRRKIILWSIVILLLCITLFFSCKKTEEAQTSDLTLEQNDELMETEEPPKENFGVTIKPRTPPLPYDETIFFETGFSPGYLGMPVWAPVKMNDISNIPEEPSEIYEKDTENNMPPAYRDMSELFKKLKNE